VNGCHAVECPACSGGGEDLCGCTSTINCNDQLKFKKEMKNQITGVKNCLCDQINVARARRQVKYFTWKTRKAKEQF
jgi:azurin